MDPTDPTTLPIKGNTCTGIYYLKADTEDSNISLESTGLRLVTGPFPSGEIEENKVKLNLSFFHEILSNTIIE